MSILDTFYILFQTDADKAAKDIEGVAKASDKAEAGLLSADAAASRLGGSFVAMAAQLAAPILALASIGGALALVHDRIEQIGDISDNAFKLRSTTEDYDAFTRSARAAGGEMAQVQANLNMFSDKLNDAAARPDGPNAKNFSKWGIVFKDVKGEAVGAVDGLLALAKSLEGVSQAEALGRLKKLGITDADTIQFLLLGKKAIQERMQAEKEAGVITDRQIELEGDYQNAIGRTRNLLDSFAGRLTEAVLPAIIKAYEAFNRFFGWMLNHEALVKGFFIGVAAVITAVLLPAMTRLAIATIAATWPFLAIAAAVAAVGAAAALAYEDIVAYMTGQNSLIGELIKKYQWLIDAAKDAWGKVVNALQTAWSAIQPIVQAIIDGAKSIVDAYIEIYKPLYDAFVNLFGAIGEAAAAFRQRIVDDVNRMLPEWKARFEEIKANVTQTFQELATAIQPFVDGVKVGLGVVEDLFRTLGEIIKAIWKSTIGVIADGINSIAEKIRSISTGFTIPVTIDTAGQAGAAMGNLVRAGKPPGAAPGVNGQTPASIGAAANSNVQQTNTVNVGDVNIQTQATDAKAIAGAVRGELQNQLRNTSSHFDNGVDR